MTRRKRKPRRKPKWEERWLAHQRSARPRPPGYVALDLQAMVNREFYGGRILGKLLLGEIADSFIQRAILQRRWVGLRSHLEVKWGLRFLVERGILRSTKLETGGRPKIVYTLNVG